MIMGMKLLNIFSPFVFKPLEFCAAIIFPVSEIIHGIMLKVKVINSRTFSGRNEKVEIIKEGEVVEVYMKTNRLKSTIRREEVTASRILY